MSGVVVRCCWFRERKFEGSRKILAQAPLAQKGSQKGKPGDAGASTGCGPRRLAVACFLPARPLVSWGGQRKVQLQSRGNVSATGREVQRRRQGPRHALCPGTGSCMS